LFNLFGLKPKEDRKNRNEIRESEVIYTLFLAMKYRAEGKDKAGGQGHHAMIGRRKGRKELINWNAFETKDLEECAANIKEFAYVDGTGTITDFNAWYADFQKVFRQFDQELTSWNEDDDFHVVTDGSTLDKVRVLMNNTAGCFLDPKCRQLATDQLTDTQFGMYIQWDAWGEENTPDKPAVKKILDYNVKNRHVPGFERLYNSSGIDAAKKKTSATGV